MATQKEIGKHLDLSDRWVRNLIKDGILPASKGKGGLNVDDCRVAYIRYLRGLATDQVHYDDEKEKNYAKMLDQEKWREKKRQNDIEEQLVAPVALLTEALEKSGNIIIPILESLPLLMKRNWPEITGDQIQQVKKAIAECRNAIADSELNLDS